MKRRRTLLLPIALVVAAALLLTALSGSQLRTRPFLSRLGLAVQEPGAENVRSRPPSTAQLSGHGAHIQRPASLLHPPLRTQGRYIVDVDGNPVRLASINWYGASDIQQVPSGLAQRHRDDIAALIRAMGFNSVRLPYSDEMVTTNPPVAAAPVAANPDLAGLPALDVFAAVTTSLTDAGLAVIPNNHITQSTWCCGANLCDAGWANDWLGPACRVRQTEHAWIRNWETVMARFAHNPLVVGADLRNEVRGPWGTMRWATWASAAERAAERLLQLNRDWLIVVEGVSSANDLSGARDRPVALSVAARVVYSAHVYAWSGWGALWPYSRRPYADFAAAMRANWGFLLEEDIAPVWVGEFGTAEAPSEGDRNYWVNLLDFLDEVGADWGYWALNPRKPAGDEWEGYGLLEDDWKTVRRDYRLEDLGRLGLGGREERAAG